MYKKTNQLSIDDFIFPYGRLKSDNRWVVMADKIPWADIERDYAAGFVNNGAPAHPARMALGALIAKQMLSVSDEELCCQVAENPYLQFFIGLKEFIEECPFGASTLVAFRKRFSDEDISRINDAILAKAKVEAEDDDDDHDDDDGGGRGGEVTMALDATVAPSDITYPQDIKLLNEAREWLESIIDTICVQTGANKPRTYRQKARRDYLQWSKSKRRGAKMTRRALRRQLAYVRRDLAYVHDLSERYFPELPRIQQERLDAIEVLFSQQLFMYENKTHSVPERIVSLSQPWVRPIVRGKACANTEFGAKVHVSTDNRGMARIDRVDFATFNESELLRASVEEFYRREGNWPDRILADKIYRTRANIAWCAERGIRLSGPKLGRRPKDDETNRQTKATERRDAADRNVVEGVFGTAKTTYGMDPVKARLEETTKTVIALAILVFNLKKLTAASLCHCFELYLAQIKRLDSAIRWVIYSNCVDKAVAPVLIGVA